MDRQKLMIFFVFIFIQINFTFTLPTTKPHKNSTESENVKINQTNANEYDGEPSRKVLGSSVVTSVSVIMETNNGSHKYYADAAGRPVGRPTTSSQLASPVTLLNPDQYEFYTFNDNGDLVKRLMTLDQIHTIIAAGGADAVATAEGLAPSAPFTSYQRPEDYQMNSETRVHDVVANVQSVLKEEVEAHKNGNIEKPFLDNTELSSSWSMILPSMFSQGDEIHDVSIIPGLEMMDQAPINEELSFKAENVPVVTEEHKFETTFMPENTETTETSSSPLRVTLYASTTEGSNESITDDLTTTYSYSQDYVTTSEDSFTANTDLNDTITNKPQPTEAIMTTSTEKITSSTEIPIKLPTLSDLLKQHPELDSLTSLLTTRNPPETTTVTTTSLTTTVTPSTSTATTSTSTIKSVTVKNTTSASTMPLSTTVASTSTSTPKTPSPELLRTNPPITNKPASSITPKLTTTTIPSTQSSTTLKSTLTTISISTEPTITTSSVTPLTTTALKLSTNAPTTSEEIVTDAPQKLFTWIPDMDSMDSTEKIETTSEQTTENNLNITYKTGFLPSSVSTNQVVLDENQGVTTEIILETTTFNNTKNEETTTNSIETTTTNENESLEQLLQITTVSPITEKESEEEESTESEEEEEEKEEEDEEIDGSGSSEESSEENTTDSTSEPTLVESIEQIISQVIDANQDILETKNLEKDNEESMVNVINATTVEPELMNDLISKTATLASTLMASNPQNETDEEPMLKTILDNNDETTEHENFSTVTITGEETTTDVSKFETTIVKQTSSVTYATSTNLTNATNNLEVTTETPLLKLSTMPFTIIETEQTTTEEMAKTTTENSDLMESSTLEESFDSLIKSLLEAEIEKDNIETMKIMQETEASIQTTTNEPIATPQLKLSQELEPPKEEPNYTTTEVLTDSSTTEDSFEDKTTETQAFTEFAKQSEESIIKDIIFRSEETIDPQTTTGASFENNPTNPVELNTTPAQTSESTTKLSTPKFKIPAKADLELEMQVLEAEKNIIFATTKLFGDEVTTELSPTTVSLSENDDLMVADEANATINEPTAKEVATENVQETIIQNLTSIITEINNATASQEAINSMKNAWKLIPTMTPHQNDSAKKKPDIKPLKIFGFGNPLKRPETTTTTTQAPLPPSINLRPAPLENLGLEAGSTQLGDDIYQFSELCNELAFRIWNSVTSRGLSSARSVFVSPFAVTSMLAMVFLGARGPTSGEMNDILKLDDMVTFNPHLVFRNVTESIEVSKNAGVAASAIVRELYSDRTKGKLLSFYKERAQQFYDGHVEEANFKIIGDVIRRRTNLLVKRQTWGRIGDYIKGNSITVRPPLAAVTASIFQTDCSGASMEGRDGELYFIVSPTIRQRRLVPIPAVVYRSGFLAGYEPGLDATAIALGNDRQVVSTIFVLPGQQGTAAPGDGLSRLEQRLGETSFRSGAWSKLLRTLTTRPGLEIQIPRFSHRSIINATHALQKMGLKELFNPKKADLRGLNGNKNELHLSDMIQVNMFTTCGEGSVSEQHHTEVYPATPARLSRNNDDTTEDDYIQQMLDKDGHFYAEEDGIRDSKYLAYAQEPRDYQRAFHDPMHHPSYLELPLSLRPRQARIPEVPRLRLDRPFLYFVRHNPTGLILHMGRFNPRLLP